MIPMVLLLFFCILFYILFTCDHDFIPPRNIECEKQLRMLYEEYKNKVSEEHRYAISVEAIEELIAKYQPPGCDYVYVSVERHSKRVLPFICCCNHESIITKYERFHLKKRGKHACLILYYDGHVDIDTQNKLCPCPTGD